VPTSNLPGSTEPESPKFSAAQNFLFNFKKKWLVKAQGDWTVLLKIEK
jgi:hypothetical protein